MILVETTPVRAQATILRLLAALAEIDLPPVFQTERHAWPELHRFLPTRIAPAYEPIDTRPGRRRPLAFAVPGGAVPVRRGSGPCKGSRLTRSPRARHDQRGSPVHP